jgi:nucleotide-binding universal stress UspA family protein
VQELILGLSNKFTAEEQLDQIAFYWIELHAGQPTPLTVRILSRNRDVSLDLEGGSRIPKASEHAARSVAELRAAGLGVRRVLLVHDGTPASSSLFEAVLTMLDAGVDLGLAAVPSANGDALHYEQDLARQLGREVHLYETAGEPGPEIVRLARDEHFDVVIVLSDLRPGRPGAAWLDHVLDHAPCPVSVMGQPAGAE